MSDDDEYPAGVYADEYERGATVEFEEGERLEFKLHRTFCIEDLPRGCEQEEHLKLKRTRQPISKTLTAFLNNGVGGVIFLGLSDEGKVVGLQLTNSQKEHVILAVSDTVSRFNPPVDLSDSSPRIEVQFARVFEEMRLPTDADPLSPASIRSNPPHSLRTGDYCWCDREALTLLQSNIICDRYVIKVWVKPWRYDVTQGGLQLPTLYENEEGLCYMRRSGSNIHYTIADAVRNTVNQCRLYYEEESRLKSKMIQCNQK